MFEVCSFGSMCAQAIILTTHFSLKALKFGSGLEYTHKKISVAYAIFFSFEKKTVPSLVTSLELGHGIMFLCKKDKLTKFSKSYHF